MNTELIVKPNFADFTPVSIESIVTMKARIAELMSKVMQEGIHFGTIPGTPTEVEFPMADGSKKKIKKSNLLKAGAETIKVTLGLVTEFTEEERDLGYPHFELIVRSKVIHAASGLVVGSGVGSCSTKESRYAYRTSSPKCPHCGKEAIKKSKFPPRHNKSLPPGWYCFEKIGGCGAEFEAQDPTIVDQPVGRTENEDIADLRNTVRKIAYKRCDVDGTIRATAASDFFTQDIEDLPEDLIKQRQTTPAAAPQTEAPATPAAQPVQAAPKAEALPEPEEYPWAWRLVGTEKLNAAWKNRALWEIPADKVRALSSPAMRLKLTPADVANIRAALLDESGRQEAARRHVEQEEANAAPSFDEDQIPEFAKAS